MLCRAPAVWGLLPGGETMPKRIWMNVLAALLLITGCSAGGFAPKTADMTAPMEAPEAEAYRGPGGGEFRSDSMDGALAQSMPAPTSAAPTTPPQTAAEAMQQRGPMLIYTATMNLAVFQVAEASKQVEQMARESGGFLARRDDTSLVIRVPAEKFEDLLKRIEKLGDVLHRNVAAEDVTEQYMDAEVRLKNARAVRDRLQQLLEKANKVEDSLAIEKELTRVGTEIETLEGKLKYLRDRARYSTITVSFQAKQTDNIRPSVRLPVDWLNQLGLGRLLSL
jgi:hypothetical protein